MYNKDFEYAYDIVHETGSVQGTRASADDGTAILAAPGAGKRYRIKELHLQAEAAGPVIVTLKTAPATSIRTYRLVADGDSHLQIYPLGRFMSWPENAALYIALSAAISVAYYIEYEIVEA